MTQQKPSILMVVNKYPTGAGHTSVIKKLCQTLNSLGFRTGIGAFSFSEPPPTNTEKIILKKKELLLNGVSNIDFDIIHPHQTRVLYYLLFKKPQKPVIFHYHSASNKIQELNLKTAIFLFKKRISKIICISKTALTHIELLCGKTNSIVVYNGVDNDFFKINSSILYKKGKPQLFFISRLYKHKNILELISFIPALLKKYPHTHLQIAGIGEDFERAKKLIQQKKLNDKIELLGKISDDELRKRYLSCDIFVSSSTHEHCPLPPVEAMACGKPSVLSGIEAHKELLENSKAGLTYELSSESDFCQKIQDVYEKSEYGFNAQNFAETHDWKIICKQIQKIYQEFSNFEI